MAKISELLASSIGRQGNGSSTPRRTDQNPQASVFEKHAASPAIDWSSVQAILEARPEKLQALYEMERTGGEPDVVGHDETTGEFIFCDCAPESPTGRRSLCYDRAGSRSAQRKQTCRQHDRDGGHDRDWLLTEQQYRELQAIGEFDRKTSSWVMTPAKIRELGGALFCDRRYTRSSSITTALNPTTPPEDFAAAQDLLISSAIHTALFSTVSTITNPTGAI